MLILEIICLALIIVGALNWGLVGLFNFDLVATIFGSSTALGSKIVYILIGICAFVGIKTLIDLISDAK